MTLVLKGVMQSPVTPLKEDFSPDYETFERLVDFHVRTGATAISWPHHKAESHNLTIAERKKLAEVAIKAVDKRVPISIHVSALALEDTFDLARHAQKTGADAIIAITPYFWKYPPEAIYDYFVRLGTSIDLPLIAYNSPELSRRHRVHRRDDRAADPASAQFHRHEGGELQQRKVLRDPERGAAAAAGVRDDRRCRISSSLSLARWRRLLFVCRRHLPQSLRRALRKPVPPATGIARASCNISCRSSGCCSATNIRHR